MLICIKFNPRVISGVRTVMPAVQPLCTLIGIDPTKLSQEENLLLEAQLFVDLWHELKEYLRQQYKNYFCTMKYNMEMEDGMLEDEFVRLIINDILSTGEYTTQGIAAYIDTHEDVVNELASGINTKPLAILTRKIIELHRSVRPELYRALGKKIASQYCPHIAKL
jgi:hypothetical protein